MRAASGQGGTAAGRKAGKAGCQLVLNLLLRPFLSTIKAETVYFNESHDAARKAVDDVLDDFQALLGRLRWAGRWRPSAVGYQLGVRRSAAAAPAELT